MGATIRAQAKDAVDTLDNLTAHLTETERADIADFVISILHRMAEMTADESRLFVDKFGLYWSAPAE